MATLRSDSTGVYYGDKFNTSSYLSSRQMQTNVTYIHKALSEKGWSLNAICGMLGNMQAESTFNPGIWQSNLVGNYSGGYGLVQWTPATNYTNWCAAEGRTDPSTMENNIARIIYEVNNGLQWYGTGDYYGMSFREFSVSTQTVDFLAVGFLLCYERPADQSQSVKEYRAGLARDWYDYITGGTPPIPDEPPEPDHTTTTKKTKGFNFVLFNANRRKRFLL